MKYRFLVAGVFLVLMLVGLLRAWWVVGHASVAEAAASTLPDEVPAFFRSAGKQLGHSLAVLSDREWALFPCDPPCIR